MENTTVAVKAVRKQSRKSVRKQSRKSVRKVSRKSVRKVSCHSTAPSYLTLKNLGYAVLTIAGLVGIGYGAKKAYDRYSSKS